MRVVQAMRILKELAERKLELVVRRTPLARPAPAPDPNSKLKPLTVQSSRKSWNQKKAEWKRWAEKAFLDKADPDHPLLTNGDSWAKLEYHARTMKPLHEFNRGLAAYQAQKNGLLLDAQYRAFVAAFGIKSAWVPALPWIFAGAGFALGFGVAWALEARAEHYLPFADFTMKVGWGLGGVAGLLCWPLAMNFVRHIKYRIAYAPLQVFQADKDDPTTTANLPVANIPRMSFLLRPGYFHGPAEASGIARGIARVQLPAEVDVMDLRLPSMFGEFCSECHAKQESDPKCTECKPGLLPVTKGYFLGTERDGKEVVLADNMVDAELFVGAGAVETRDLLRDGLEKGMLDTAVDKKLGAADMLKNNWQWVAGIALLILTFLNITTGYDINMDSIDFESVTNAVTGQGK